MGKSYKSSRYGHPLSNFLKECLIRQLWWRFQILLPFTMGLLRFLRLNGQVVSEFAFWTSSKWNPWMAPNSIMEGPLMKPETIGYFRWRRISTHPTVCQLKTYCQHGSKTNRMTIPKASQNYRKIWRIFEKTYSSFTWSIRSILSFQWTENSNMK